MSDNRTVPNNPLLGRLIELMPPAYDFLTDKQAADMVKKMDWVVDQEFEKQGKLELLEEPAVEQSIQAKGGEPEAVEEKSLDRLPVYNDEIPF